MTRSAPIITGYYRYTDILFEWHQVIDDLAERSALKAFVSNKSLTDPKNPLRSEGDKGLELYIGTLKSNGQQRLMFSSAQVEYIRYWLHAMGLTKNPLPLPSSEYLLTESESLRNCTSVFFNDPKELKKAVTNVQKDNKRLKGSDSALMSARLVFEKVRQYWHERQGTWLGIDFESWEYEHDLITECGWKSIQWKEGNEVTANGHYIIEENKVYTNGKYVPNMRDRYNFGTSETVKKVEFKRIIHKMITEFTDTGPLFLVFHDFQQDIKHLKSKHVDAPLDDLSYILPDVTPETGIFVIDTALLFGALQGDISESRSLERTCALLKIQTACLHNAGNDAYYTLLALRSMASGNQLDAQREQRWPNQTHRTQKGTSVKVEFKPWEEDSDYSDMEGAFARPTHITEPTED